MLTELCDQAAHEDVVRLQGSVAQAPTMVTSARLLGIRNGES
jgi:hypothetical protein